MKYGTYVWLTKPLLTKPDKNSLCFSYFGRCKFLPKSLKTFAKCIKKEFRKNVFYGQQLYIIFQLISILKRRKKFYLYNPFNPNTPCTIEKKGKG